MSAASEIDTRDRKLVDRLLSVREVFAAVIGEPDDLQKTTLDTLDEVIGELLRVNTFDDKIGEVIAENVTLASCYPDFPADVEMSEVISSFCDADTPYVVVGGGASPPIKIERVKP